MPDFKNVSINKSANIFYEGRVTSRNLEFEDGTRKTLGIMLPGEYKFNTIHKEIMEINSGELEYKLPADEEWTLVIAPGSFEIPANSKFDIKINKLVDYCCSFIK
jgi:uncharacterized protein YaiE (UPF0345 family)